MNKSNLLLVAILICIAIIVGVVVGDDDPSQSGPTAQRALDEEQAIQPPSPIKLNEEDDKAALDQLRQIVEQEQQLRAVLQEKVAKLSKELEIIKRSTTLPTSAVESGEENVEHDKSSDNSQAIPQRVSGWIEKNRLIAAGLSQNEANQITQLYENVEMEKLYLRDRAQREGWMASRRFRDEMDKLRDKTDNLRNELGEDAYDALLYASGRPNRVFVEGSLGNSPARQAGIEQGDAIIKYAGERIYTWSDLREATSKGDINEMVPVEIQRGDKRLEVYVKRGPLGIRLNQQVVNPRS